MPAARSPPPKPRGLRCAGAVQRLPPPPALPRPPAPVTFPVIAVVAPLLAAVVIGLLTGSAFVLVFAVLSPVIAVATVLDGRRAARRHRRQEAERFARECAAFAHAIDRAHSAERAEAEASHPAVPAAPGSPSGSPVRVGSGPRPSAAAIEAPLLTGEGPDEARLAALLERARLNPALPLLVPRGAIAVRGAGAAAAAVAARVSVEPGCSVRVIAEDEPPDPGATLLVVRSALRIEIHPPEGEVLVGRPELLSRRQLAPLRAALAAAHPPSPPPTISWAALHAAGAGRPAGGGILVGHDGAGVVELDLQADGPHALIGGTTGSGKSEFLRTLALSWASTRSPHELQLLFVDFKGGATFAGLMGLPHAVGLITDLDPLIAERTLLGLRAELQRRERLLVEHGVRDAAEAPAVMSRLVVLVDEFAALIDAFPALHAPFADLSARGRSLGVHLVLGTQHPAAAVRDAVAANCAVRVAFRLSETAGAAFVGATGRSLAAAPPGRALLVSSAGERVLQVAVAGSPDIAEVAARWAGSPAGASPWLPPLPSRVRAVELEHLADDQDATEGDAETGLRFGMLDDPAALRRSVARWRPRHDGPLAITGCPGSGRTTALAAVTAEARAAGSRVLLLPSDLPSAWGMLEALQRGEPACDLLVADDLDVLVAEAEERGPELLGLWDSAVRTIRRRGGGALAAVGPASGARSLLGGRFAVRLVLRALDADDHALAGAPRGLFDRGAPAGRGWWLDQQVQVVADATPLEPATMPAPLWSPPLDRPTAVVSRRPQRAASLLEHLLPGRTVTFGPPALPLSEAAPTVYVADPDEWQGAWGALSALRRAAPVLIVDAEAADLRGLLSVRTTAPPIDPDRGEAWLLEQTGPPLRVRMKGLGAP